MIENREQLAILTITITVLWVSSFIPINREKHAILLSKDQSMFLRGFGALSIILHHLAIDVGAKTGISGLYYAMGAPATGIFFFVSGYGVYKSLGKSSQKRFKWLLHHIGNILIPFFVVWIMDWIVYILINPSKTNIYSIFKSGATLTMIGYENWFVKAIILVYILTIVLEKMNHRLYPYFLAVCAFIYLLAGRYLGINAWWYNSVWLFPVGLIASKEEDKYIGVIDRNRKVVTAALLFVIIGSCIFHIGGELETLGALQL